MLGKMFAAACTLLAFAASAQRAHAAPKPVAPPPAHHNTLHPVPYPGASTTTSSSSTSSSSTHVTAARLTVVSTAVDGALHQPVASTERQRPASRSKPPAPQTKTQPPAQNRGRPVGFQDAAGLNELRSAASSSSSALLLAAGIALLLLVIGETTFLGLASSRLGVAGSRVPVRRRPPEEPFPIRRIQLRR